MPENPPKALNKFEYGTYYLVMERYFDTCFDEYQKTSLGDPVAVWDNDLERAQRDAHERTLIYLRENGVELGRYISDLPGATKRKIYLLVTNDEDYVDYSSWEDMMPIDQGLPANVYVEIAKIIDDLFFFITTVPMPPPG